MEVCSRGGEVAFKRSEQDLVAMELRETLCLSFSLCRVKWDVLDCFLEGGGGDGIRGKPGKFKGNEHTEAAYCGGFSEWRREERIRKREKGKRSTREIQSRELVTLFQRTDKRSNKKKME